MQVKPELSQTRVVIQLLSKPIPWFINKHYPLISYVLTATNKQLLISESHSDSNRCTPCRGKPGTHDIYASHISPRTPSVRFLRTVPVRQVYASYGQSPYVATFHTNPTELDGWTTPEKKCSHLYLSARLSSPRDLPQFLFQPSH
jgi:hypothetical protein